MNTWPASEFFQKLDRTLLCIPKNSKQRFAEWTQRTSSVLVKFSELCGHSERAYTKLKKNLQSSANTKVFRLVSGYDIYRPVVYFRLLFIDRFSPSLSLSFSGREERFHIFQLVFCSSYFGLFPLEFYRCLHVPKNKEKWYKWKPIKRSSLPPVPPPSCIALVHRKI